MALAAALLTSGSLCCLPPFARAGLLLPNNVDVHDPVPSRRLLPQVCLPPPPARTERRQQGGSPARSSQLCRRTLGSSLECCVVTSTHIRCCRCHRFRAWAAPPPPEYKARGGEDDSAWCAPYAYKERRPEGCGGADRWSVIPEGAFPAAWWAAGTGNIYCAGGQFCPNTTATVRPVAQ